MHWSIQSHWIGPRTLHMKLQKNAVIFHSNRYNFFHNCNNFFNSFLYIGNDFHNNFFQKIFAVSNVVCEGLYCGIVHAYYRKKILTCKNNFAYFITLSAIKSGKKVPEPFICAAGTKHITTFWMNEFWPARWWWRTLEEYRNKFLKNDTYT